VSLITEGYHRIAAVRRGDDDGYGEIRSLRNFNMCQVAQRLKELRPMADWFFGKPINVQGANLRDEVFGDLIDEYHDLNRLAIEIRRTLAIISRSAIDCTSGQATI
jgi:hypothetical protein